jgi:hypothetical protein
MDHKYSNVYIFGWKTSDVHCAAFQWTGNEA